MRRASSLARPLRAVWALAQSHTCRPVAFGSSNGSAEELLRVATVPTQLNPSDMWTKNLSAAPPTYAVLPYRDGG